MIKAVKEVALCLTLLILCFAAFPGMLFAGGKEHRCRELSPR